MTFNFVSESMNKNLQKKMCDAAKIFINVGMCLEDLILPENSMKIMVTDTIPGRSSIRSIIFFYIFHFNFSFISSQQPGR